MVEVINSSFIPKKDLSKKKGPSSGPSVNVFLLISVIIFLSTIVASVGVYLWKENLKEDNVSLLNQIEENKNLFSLATLQSLIDLDTRINASTEILGNHYTVMPIFFYLQENTLSDVILDDFNLAEEGDSVIVTAKGFADDFDTIAVQSEKYSADDRVENLILDSYDRDKDGMAVFDLSFSWKKKNLRE